MLQSVANRFPTIQFYYMIEEKVKNEHRFLFENELWESRITCFSDNQDSLSFEFSDDLEHMCKRI